MNINLSGINHYPLHIYIHIEINDLPYLIYLVDLEQNSLLNDILFSLLVLHNIFMYSCTNGCIYEYRE